MEDVFHVLDKMYALQVCPRLLQSQSAFGNFKFRAYFVMRYAEFKKRLREKFDPVYQQYAQAEAEMEQLHKEKVGSLDQRMFDLWKALNNLPVHRENEILTIVYHIMLTRFPVDFFWRVTGRDAIEILDRWMDAILLDAEVTTEGIFMQFKTQLYHKTLNKTPGEKVEYGIMKDVESPTGYRVGHKGMQALEEAAEMFVRDEIAKISKEKPGPSAPAAGQTGPAPVEGKPGQLSGDIKQGAYQETCP